MNILICDDNQNEAAALDKVIADSGFHVNTIIFHRGEGAINYVRSDAKIDACFLDIIMPEMTGVSLASFLREEGFGGVIIFLTSSNEYAAESYKVDAFSYLIKPPDTESVVSVLKG